MSDAETTSFQVAEEILDQPRAWSTAVAAATTAGPHPLPAGGRVAVVGCGSSMARGEGPGGAREAAGQGETDAFPASEARLRRPYQRVLAISRSGTTTEVRDAFDSIPAGVHRTALVGDPASPLAAAADGVVDLSFADDLSVVQSRFVTTIVVLGRAWLGEDVAALPAQAEAALAAPHPADPGAVDRVFLLGRGWRVGVADAGALALRETAQLWAESYPAMDFATARSPTPGRARSSGSSASRRPAWSTRSPRPAPSRSAPSSTRSPSWSASSGWRWRLPSAAGSTPTGRRT